MGRSPRDDDDQRSGELDATVPGRPSGATHAFAETRPSGAHAAATERTGELRAGDRIGRFVLHELLGAGGMGAVFAARDTDLERRVAIKVLRRRDGRAPGPTMRARLLREAQAAARLSHRNVVTVYEVGAIDDGPAAGQVFVAMELVDGNTLARWQEEPRDWREIVEVYLQAARGLAAAHAAGLVHRDFKPDNALINKDGEVRVTDFGLASVSGQPEPSRDGDAAPTSPLSLSPSGGITRLTSTGDIMGTPLFMAPEQRAGAAVDARADQYALCVALFRALYGIYPYGTDSEASLARRAEAHELAPAPPGKRVPRALHKLLVRGLEPDPGARWPDLPTLIARLEHVLGARRRLAIAAGAIVTVAIGGTLAVVAALGGDDARASCASARAELGKVWNDDARARGAAGFSASGLVDADQAWQRVASQVDAWGETWITAHTAACEATRVLRRDDEATLARRHACLAGQRDVLAGVLARWSRADREAASRATEAILRLPRADDCAAPPATTPGARAEQVEALRATLRDLSAAGIAGRFIDELPRARAALVEAQALADRGLEAEAGLLVGRFERLAAQDSARSTLFEAAAAAEASGRDDLAVEAWSEWIYVAASSGVDDAEVQAASRRAEAALKRAGSDRRLLGILRNNQGVAAYEAMRDQEALALFEEAVAIRVELYGRDDPRTADVLDNLGNVYAALASNATGEARKDYFEKEIAAGMEAYEIRKRTLGETSVAVARSLHNVGSALDNQGRWEEAMPFYDKALAAKTVAMGPDHPGLGTTLVRRGELLMRMERYEESLADYTRCVAIWERNEGPFVGSLATPLQGQYEALIGLGRHEEAIAPALRSALLRKDDPPRKRKHELAVAIARLDAGQVDAALAGLREHVAVEAESYALDDPRRIRGLTALARAELAAGLTKQAAGTLDRALKILPKATNLDPQAHADLLLTQAELAAARGDRAAARAGAAAAMKHCENLYCLFRYPSYKARAQRLR